MLTPLQPCGPPAFLKQAAHTPTQGCPTEAWDVLPPPASELAPSLPPSHPCFKVTELSADWLPAQAPTSPSQPSPPHHLRQQTAAYLSMSVSPIQTAEPTRTG